MTRYDICDIFIYSNSVSIRWQLSIDMYEKKQKRQHKRRNYTQDNTKESKKYKIHKIGNKNTKQKTNMKIIL